LKKELFRKKSVDLMEIYLLNASNKELLQLSKELGIGLSLEEMKRVRQYFRKKQRLPTDVELEAIGQAWSEHCCYKSSKLWLKKYIYPIEREKVIAREDAGVIEFDQAHYLTVALESHNHPSAISPYGGAATGIGGIVRDILCMGAQPIGLIDPLFFGPLDWRFEKLPEGVKHPRYLFRRVVEGIRDYGNRIGIPTIAGQVCFDESYLGNPVVNVGCIGLVKKGELIHSYATQLGEAYVLAGGKTGRDGIHGVTFASADLDERSEQVARSCVQIGDPITKEPLIHAFRECVEEGLVEGSKDLGGGGLSCASSELAWDGGYGAEICLDRIPLKEVEMRAWEIWVSESQERMMLLVKNEKVDRVIDIFKSWDILATPIGRVIKEPIIRVFYKKRKVLELDLSFLLGELVQELPYELVKPIRKDSYRFNLPNLNKAFLQLAGTLPIASREWVIRQYDHEVRGATVLKPLQGKLGFETHGDAPVIKPLRDSNKGIALASDVNPSFMKLDPWRGSLGAVDEVCRNLVAVGAKPLALADCLNLGDPTKPQTMGELRLICKALNKIASRLGLPFISGNVSLYNEGPQGSIVPTPLVLGIGEVEDISLCTTTDLKESGNLIYLIGETRREMGGSQYYKLLGMTGGIVPTSDPNKLKHSIDALLEANHKRLISSIHDVAEGGIAIALAEMAIGGDLGCELSLKPMGKLRIDFKLFSESNTRWIVEVKKEKAKEFGGIFEGRGVEATKLGRVKGKRIRIADGKEIINLPINLIRDSWESGLKRWMG
jgi:phosphoribosylformylglycinamidine synthase